MTAGVMGGPLVDAALRVGHRELADTFSEFVREVETGDCRQAAESAAGAVAFLRHGVLPFARREEALYLPGGAVGEEVAFEHAFLAAEAEALAREAGALSEGGAKALAGVRRRVVRIQAVLELHVAKSEDRDVSAAEPPESAPDADAGGAASPFQHRVMEPAEVATFLGRGTWGMLATFGGGLPYAVPVGYAWDEGALYFASGAGRKRSNLEEHPVACLTVADVENGSRWRCVVAAGRVVRLTGPLARVRALDLIRRKRGGALPPARDLRKMLSASVFRLDVAEVSGRSVG
jgi:nitroimidazol reductase NimA-like FMN-containing flavoprotein (pyridoxamine 5'-phosphate oxidase superfamily)